MISQRSKGGEFAADPRAHELMLGIESVSEGFPTAVVLSAAMDYK